MNRTTPDDTSRGDPAASLRSVGEALAATASLEHLARLIARQIRDAAGAQRVVLLTRDGGGQLRPAADVADGDPARAAKGDVVAVPLAVRGGVEAVAVVRDGTHRSAFDGFLPQAAWAVATVRAAQGGPEAAAQSRARIAGQMLHEVNNRLGAIQNYAYLLAERLKRGEDGTSLEVAGKLCTAVERLGTSIAGLGASEALPAAARSATDLDALVDGAVAALADELAGRGVRIRREAGGAGPVLVHEPTMGDALRTLLRQLGALEGAGERLAVTTERPSPRTAAVVVDCAVGGRCIADALFAGDAGDLGRALARDLIEQQAGSLSVARIGEDGALLRIELAAATG